MLAGADVFIGVSVPGAVTRARDREHGARRDRLRARQPAPEIEPEEIEDCVAIIASGRSDYPNQINNLLAFPGVFRGALDVRATAITPEMKIAAAHALAESIAADELSVDYIIPSVFDRTVAHAVAKAVAAAAHAGDVAEARRARARIVAAFPRRLAAESRCSSVSFHAGDSRYQRGGELDDQGSRRFCKQARFDRRDRSSDRRGPAGARARRWT